ncbi:MAG: peptide chain release factor-like protein [Planctomycetota bacterium]|nr:MAG: peptide chain release factor-like protein [Planctomycetota bacterium]
MHPARLSESELLAQCELHAVRRSGPGGQRRNKVATGVVLIHRPTGIRAEASERRHREENRRLACRRLRERLAVQCRSPEAASAPSELWQRRRVGRRIVVRADHPDFPALLAEALDVVHERAYDLVAAAAQLGVTPSQLLKLLAKSSHAWQYLQKERAARGLAPLKRPE